MAKYTGPACRQCRREGVKLFGKGERCYTEKCALNRRTGAPGQHGAARKKIGEYGKQLREKQKAKRSYGLLEKQFRGYFKKAENMDGVVGENMLQLLERRLDNVVYRLGFADSRAQSRQVVNHGHVTVNGKKVNIPSFIVKAGDVIAIAEGSTSIEKFKALREGTAKAIPAWLELNSAELSGKVVELPKREDIDLSIEEHLIVELYSR